MKKLSTPNNYNSLVAKITHELSGLEYFVKRRTAEGYWKVGRYIHEHLLAHKDRADYGKFLIERLAEDVDRDTSILNRSLRFYRTYPIQAVRPELNWNHYKTLITVNDQAERKKLEQKIIDQEWNAQKLQKYLSIKRELTAPADGDKSIPQLKFNRGRLNTYQIVPANEALAAASPLVLDLGFRLQQVIPDGAPKFKEADTLELAFKGGDVGAVKVAMTKDELFTYQAKVEKVIDGDTLLAAFVFHLDHSLSQKLRLRGIDCPEMDTEEGKRAKRFVESRLKDCDFIIVKTYKDRSDKFDRYLADIFYPASGAADPAVAAKEGVYLNQELLNEGLAVKYEGVGDQ